MADETFKISAALKDLIGRELITDEFVAIFELVKNSFDANATNVEVIFENNKSEKDFAKIIIKDNGKGMTSDDISNKWLFVAYSAKRLGIENEDYRDKIKVNRLFAGAKGVGRFSCDRLGKHLKLTTIKDKKNAEIEQLNINWEDFEGVDEEMFINIPVSRQTILKHEYGIRHGTVLEISGLREDWNRKKLQRLKRSLSKLINPNQNNDSERFSIKIVADDEATDDRYEENQLDKINGEVKNSIFETLEIKSSNLLVQISEDGKTFETTLQDRGDMIYYVKEINPYPELKAMSFYLFQLNRSAKYSFTRLMGIAPKSYGSVFMYKNGFRIYPYGEPGDDSLAIDLRKSQGRNRFLGARDLIGRIEINGEQRELKETTSRDGGLVKTKTYDSLVRFFKDFVLRRLENYVVDIIKWGDERINQQGEMTPELWAKDVKIQILELITGFINKKGILEIEYDKDFLNIITSKQDSSVDKIVKNISRVAAQSGNEEIVIEARKIQKVVKEIKADADKDREELKKEETLRIVAESELQTEKIKTEFYKKQLAPDADALIHHIKNNNIAITKAVENIIQDIKDPTYKNDDLIRDLSFILFHSNKAIKAANIITHVDLSESDAQHVELNSFLEGYIANYHEISNSRRIKFKYQHTGGIFNVKLSKIELAIVIDNLEDNAFKWGAKNILIKTNTVNNKLFQIEFCDDGAGLSDKYILDPTKIFKFKETGLSNGTGLGLYVVEEILNRMGAKISFVGNKVNLKGATFLIDFSR
ncbi:sensor histidine kinase [Flavobacterium subsaxonicum]|uniref:sensor histidine kinase n=1 Tax=Flavobacterium subsaxonicum TaxID=426226 RepID=UPI0004288DAA|nr:sensor histidine kinase [Flavobacterium subsaxonicum]